MLPQKAVDEKSVRDFLILPGHCAVEGLALMTRLPSCRFWNGPETPGSLCAYIGTGQAGSWRANVQVSSTFFLPVKHVRPLAIKSERK